MQSVRLNVDDSTAKLLTEINDFLGDAMRDLVKLDDLKQQLGGAEARISGAIGKTGAVLEHLFEAIKQRLEVVHVITSELADAVPKLDLTISRNYDQLNNALTSLKASLAPIGAIVTEVSELKAEVHNFSQRLDVLEHTISLVTDQLTRLNRPWWRKILE